MPRDYTKNPNDGDRRAASSSNFALLFKARNREKERDREFEGHGEILCPSCGNVGRFWLSGWKKISQKAGEFISISFKPKEQAQYRGDEMPSNGNKFPWDKQ